MPVLPLKV
jgi:hypothetical protein